MRSFTSRGRLLATATAALVLGGCVDDGASLVTVVDTPANGGALFQRYVSLGNSITAGYQSGGIVDTLQLQAYPVLLARRAGVAINDPNARVSFNVPLLARPGCGAPFTAPLVAATGTPPCALRDPAQATSPINNVAVPGARIADLLRIPGGQLAQLNTFLVGPRSQVRAMIEAEPTFVSVWIGNNDALEAAVSGNLGPAAAGADSVLTSLAAFQASLNAIVDSIKVAAPQGALLIGVVNAATAAPVLQPGAYFFLARDGEGRFNNKPVNNNCSPVTPLGQPNPLAANLVSFRVVADANFPEINCDPGAFPAGDPRRGVHLLDTQEQVVVGTRVAQFNAAIQAAAVANGWVYADPNAILATVANARDGQGRFQRLRKCQLLPGATSAETFQQAVALSCPVPGTGPTAAFAAPNFFGTLVSFDGVHPSAEAHRLLAGEFATIINTKYGTTLSNTTTAAQ